MSDNNLSGDWSEFAPRALDGTGFRTHPGYVSIEGEGLFNWLSDEGLCDWVSVETEGT